MDFINKRFSSILSIIFYVAIVFVVIYFLFQLLPFILIALLFGWLGVKGVRIIKNWNNKRNSGGNVVNNMDIMKDDDLGDLSNKQVIDVEYKDVLSKKE